jgi:hypothetical protein
MSITLRTVVVDGVTYQVNRLYSSGLGVQYACTSKDADGKEKTILVSEETLDKDPAHAPLFKACERRFDDQTTFAKYLGSSTFWQSSPTGGGQGTMPPTGTPRRE